ncbi:DUF2971 domain-containing protein [Vibrio cholerae]|nr:DUF2971 domain-containing protein [Vibrio cholerae]EKG0020875.1 DUF2971 domain-containing protein [Vibrio cholerae]
MGGGVVHPLIWRYKKGKTLKLYHYTDAYGLIGILQNRSLWATDINFLNDSMEFEAGISALKQYCNLQISNINAHNLSTQLEDSLTDLYNNIHSIIEKNLRNRNNYIISFTSKKDNLRQWMSYCPPNSGYCIEFDSEEILLSGDKESELNLIARVEPVDYKDGDFERRLGIKTLINSLDDPCINIDQFSVNLVNEIMFHACAIKKCEFHDESETRIVIQSMLTPKHNTKYRVKSGVILPYVEYPIEKSWIKKIIVGPNINMVLARKGLNDLIGKLGISCEVEESNCSLRTF